MTAYRTVISSRGQVVIPAELSAVNWGEVFYITWRRHGEAKAREAEAALREMPITVIVVDRERTTRLAQ